MCKCTGCGKQINNPYYINGKAYGYSCYKKQLALIYKQWEDERNKEYSQDCFAVMQVFQNKKSNSFHDSICKQWKECKKLTGKQLACIKKGFTNDDKIQYWIVKQALATDKHEKSNCADMVQDLLYKIRRSNAEKFIKYFEDEAVVNCLRLKREYVNGFHIWKDIEDDFDYTCISSNSEYLQDHKEDEFIEVLKIFDFKVENGDEKWNISTRRRRRR